MAGSSRGKKRTGKGSGSPNKRPQAAKRSSNAGNKRGNRTFANLITVDDSIRDEVILLLILAVAVLLYLALFNVLGSFGLVVSGVLFGIFGLVSYLVPLAIFLSGAFYISNRGREVAYIKLIAAAFLLIVLCSFAHLIFNRDAYVISVLDYYRICAGNRSGGGLIGGMVTSFLSGFIGGIGTVVLLIILSIICLVLITEKSFFSGVKKGSETAYNLAKEEGIRRRRISEQKREERDKLRLEREKYIKEHPEEFEKRSKNTKTSRRIEKKVSGVALEDTIIRPAVINDDMHEIYPDDENEEISGDISDENIKDSSGDSSEDIREIFSGDEWEETAARNEAGSVHDDGVITSFNARTSHHINIEDDDMYPGDHDLNETDETGTAPNDPPQLSKGKPGALKPESDQVKKEIRKQEKRNSRGGYCFPPVNFLRASDPSSRESNAQLRENARELREALSEYDINIEGDISFSQGPTVTRYEFKPAGKTRLKRIIDLADEIKFKMAVTDVRIEAPIPGRAAVGIELPNKKVSTVSFRELVESRNFKDSESKISFAVGIDLSGEVVVSDIAKMPHLLIAGSTGSGKSVCINTLIMSILYKATPDEVKFIMIDPKVVELSVYNKIPHLLIPVVTDPKMAAAALNWGVAEMTDRYNKFAELGVRDMKGYNKKIDQMSGNEDKIPKKLPQIVIIVDELADLMMVSKNEVEGAICRLAQLARAAGIHLIIATQRPSVDVITGLIKANMPSRVAFAVSSGVDSRTILDSVGAERLLGKGDMLFNPQGYTKPARIQGAFISDQEINDIVNFISDNNSAGSDIRESEEIMAKVNAAAASAGSSGPLPNEQVSDQSHDELFSQAGRLIIEKDKASIGMLQRALKIGFNRAARIMDQLCEAGVVGDEEGTKPRNILMSMEQFEQYTEENI